MGELADSGLQRQTSVEAELASAAFPTSSDPLGNDEPKSFDHRYSNRLRTTWKVRGPWWVTDETIPAETHSSQRPSSSLARSTNALNLGGMKRWRG